MREAGGEQVRDGEVSETLERVTERVVDVIDRRRFLRKMATTAFSTLAMLAAGAGLDLLRSRPAWASHVTACSGNGLGCPSQPAANNPCGMSRCCNYIRARTPRNCNCRKSGATCKTNSDSVNCYGRDTRAYTDGCWTCPGRCVSCTGGCCRIQTTCCDCKTNATNCGDPDLGGNRGRCIAWAQTAFSCAGC